VGELALRSKGHWGYDAAFLAACRADRRVPASAIAAGRVFAAEVEGQVVGFAWVQPLGEDADLAALFVEPAAIGRGIGRLLWNEAVAWTRTGGYRYQIVKIDPFAEGFYLAMGATRIGESESTVFPGRMLPLLRYRVMSVE
jgi:GNAT superfamily N-acetyltransferase